jgi:hypothetical protein
MDVFANVEMYIAHEEAKLNPDAYEVKLFHELNGKKLISAGKRLLSGITAFSILGVANSSIAQQARVSIRHAAKVNATSGLNIRSNPGAKPPLFALSNQTPVTVLGEYEQDKKYLRIEFEYGGKKFTGTVPKKYICDGGAYYIPTCPEVKLKQVLKSKELKESFEKIEPSAKIKLQHPDAPNNGLWVYDERGNKLDALAHDANIQLFPERKLNRIKVGYNKFFKDGTSIPAIAYINDDAIKYIIPETKGAKDILQKVFTFADETAKTAKRL